MEYVLGITGASGVQYGIRTLEVLSQVAKTHLIITHSAKSIIKIESNFSVQKIENMATYVYEENELTAPVASGSYQFNGAIIAPCSMKTLASIANGISDTLITRVADVCLKEGKTLILMPRETPLSLIHLKNMVAVKQAGAIILPACPAFYPQPQSISDIIDFMVGKALDLMKIDHDLYKRWGD
ncbi:MAG: UbiX family flavin prenyltransferase [Methanosarcinales archaeon]